MPASKTALISCLFCVFSAFAAWPLDGHDSRAASPPATNELKAFVHWSGPESAIEKPLYTVVRSERDWLELWATHTGKPVKKGNMSQPLDAPLIDFDACMVVAIFQGTKWNSNGVKAVSITEESDLLRFRFDESTYQTAMAFGNPVAAKREKGSARPYGIFVLPRVNKTVVIEENVQGMKDRPAKWSERERIASTPKM